MQSWNFDWTKHISVFEYIYLAIILLSFVISVRFSKNLPKNMKWVPYLCLLHFVLELSSDYASSFLENNRFLYHFSMPIEYCIYSAIFYNTFKNFKWNKYILFAIPIYIILWLWIIKIDGLEHIHSKAFGLTCCFVIPMCLIYIRNFIANNDDTFIWSDKFFWFTIGCMMYFMGKFFIFGLMDLLIAEDLKMARRISYSSHFFNYSLFISIIIACFVGKNKSNESL